MNPFLRSLILLGASAIAAHSAALPSLKVSDNRRFLVQADGKPFFYLGDTAWELFHRLDRAETDHYLRTRARQGFTVIQAVTLAEFDGLTVPNAFGHLPLSNNDSDEAQCRLLRARRLGAGAGGGAGPLHRPAADVGRQVEQAPRCRPGNLHAGKCRDLREWLGRRYKDRAVIWIVGGDRPVESETHSAIVRAMAQGLRRGDGGRHLITFHPSGGKGSAQYFHAEPWLDFNMRQNGHAVEFTDRYSATRTDYDLTPTKPVLDGEPVYEGHPVSFNAKTRGHSIAADVRRPLYWDLFTGACGHTYGHHSVWQMAAPERKAVNAPLMPWREALEEPGARQMIHGRRLIESRPFLPRIPDDEIIVTGTVPTAVPGAGLYRFVATRDREGTYAMVYVPAGRTFGVRMDKISGTRVRASWFDPRTGAVTEAGEFSNQGTRDFISPTPGEALDWVLVLDDAAKNYPPPGTPRASR